MCTLHGVTWLHVEQTPTCDFAKSARVKPTACNIARPGARSGPSRTRDECGRLAIVTTSNTDSQKHRNVICETQKGSVFPCFSVSVEVVGRYFTRSMATVRLDQWLDIACLYK